MRTILALAALSLTAACASTPPVERWTGAPISTELYESHPAFDPVTRDLYFTRSAPNFTGWRLFVSACGERRRRLAPVAPSFASPDGVEADPFFTEDGRWLYFISSRPEAGVAQREMDIWRVERSGGGWGQPQRLPPPVNSEGQEWFPRVAADGWLYFGSNRPGGLGRTDIYRAQEDGVGGWRVQNLGPNINTEADEFEAEIAADGKRMVIMAAGDLYESRLRDGEWRARERLDDVNTEAMEVGPLLSRDGRELMFARDTGDAALSGEIFRLGRSGQWPPRCRG